MLSTKTPTAVLMTVSQSVLYTTLDSPIADSGPLFPNCRMRGPALEQKMFRCD